MLKSESGKELEIASAGSGLMRLYYRIEVKDISLTDYINVSHAVYVREFLIPFHAGDFTHRTTTAHTAGRYAKKQFAKGRMPIVERLVNAYV